MAAALTIALIAASTVVGVVGQVVQGKQQQSQANAQAKIYEYNSKVAVQNAKVARDQANYNEYQQRARVQRFLGNQRAAFASNGGDFSGSAVDVLADTTSQAEVDALAIRYGGIIDSNSFLNQSKTSNYQAYMARQAGQAAGVNSLIGATGTVLGGVSKIAGYGEQAGLWGPNKTQAAQTYTPDSLGGWA